MENYETKITKMVDLETRIADLVTATENKATNEDMFKKLNKLKLTRYTIQVEMEGANMT